MGYSDATNRSSVNHDKIAARVLIILIMILSIVVSALGSLFIYNFFKSRSEVAMHMNANIDIYNTTSESSSKIIADLNELTDFNGKNDIQIRDALPSIKEKTQKLGQEIQTIKLDANKLNPGYNQETTDAYNQLKSSLTQKADVLTEYSGFLVYQTCIVESMVNQTILLKTFSDDLKSFAQTTSTTPKEERLTSLRSSLNAIKNIAEYNSKISLCYVGQYEENLTDTIKEQIAADVQLYSDYSQALESLNQGIANDNPQLLQQGNEKLSSVGDKSPVFLTSKELRESLEQPLEGIRKRSQELDATETKVNDIIEDLKSRYRF